MPKCWLYPKWTRTFGPPISEPTLPFDLALIAMVVSICADSTVGAASICVPTSSCESTGLFHWPSLQSSSEDSHRTWFDEMNPSVTSVSQDSAMVENSTV